MHAYVLMTNHIHLLLSARRPENLSRLPQYLGRLYVPYFNKKYGRSGTLWEGRFKAGMVDTERYLLICYRYIELNPVRAGIVFEPGEYAWSSYAANALGHEDPIITPHALYLRLGDRPSQRAVRYREGFDEAMDTNAVESIRSSVQTGTPLGSERFKSEIEQLLGVRVGAFQAWEAKQKRGR